MTDSAYQYTGLICSLPACNSLFGAKNTPISRYQLHQRLRELEPEDAEDIRHLSELLDWFQQPVGRSDEQLMALFNRYLQAIHSPDIREMLVWRMTFRSVVAALRKRHHGDDFPGISWAYGRWMPLIKQHWHEPTLGLEKYLPWVAEAVQCLREERAMDLEKLVLNHVWQWLERLSWEHQFDLAGVAIYRMRWDLISRWVCYNPELARTRFADMVDKVVAQAVEQSP